MLVYLYEILILQGNLYGALLRYKYIYTYILWEMKIIFFNYINYSSEKKW